MEVQYLTLSFSHKNTPINVREKLALSSDKIPPFLTQLKQKITAIEEVLFLSTCNRVEFYIITHTPKECIADVLGLFASERGVHLSELEKYCQIALNQEAVHHIFSVVSSLDSAIVGETQIVGQVKEAYKRCLELRVCSKNITRVIHFAFRCAAQVRNQTQISKDSVSIASVAVKSALYLINENLAKNKNQNLGKNAIVIGLGEIGRLVVKYLLDSEFHITLINRDMKKALDFSKNFLREHRKAQIDVLEFKKLPKILHQFSFLFSATRSSEPIITQDMLSLPDKMPRFWFDLAVPRDIQEDIKGENLKIFCVDDLKNTIQENLQNKKIKAHQAYAIIGNTVGEYFSWLAGLDVEPIIKTMRQNAKNACLQELNRAIKKGYLPQEWEKEVGIILKNAFNVFLHNPTMFLRELCAKEEGDIIIEAVKSIFGDDNSKQSFANHYKCEYATTK